MGRFIISPDKFKSLEADAEHSDKITSLRMTGEYSGVIDTHDVSLEFNYDFATQTLNFVVGKKHSLAAKMASDNVIERHITEVLFNLESAPTKQPEPEAKAPEIHVQSIPGTVNTPVGPKIPFTVKQPIPQDKTQS